MGSNALNLQQGAFTNLTAAIIAGAIAQAGLATTGNIYYLDPANGNDLWNGQAPVQAGLGSQGGVGPVQSLAAGYALLVPGHNDVLVLIGNGTTTATARTSLTTTFTWAKNAAHLIGIAAPSRLSQRARLAPPTVGTGFAGPQLTVSGNGCLFANLEIFQGYATGVVNQINVRITGNRNVFRNCQISGMGDTVSAASAGSRSLVIATGENYFDHCVIGLDTIQRSGANASVEFTSGAARNVFENCIFPIDATGGAPLVVKALTGGIDRFTLFKQCEFINSINSGGASETALGSIGANGGGPNGVIVYKNCTLVGIAEWEGTTKTSAYVDGPAVNSATGVSVNPA